MQQQQQQRPQSVSAPTTATAAAAAAAAGPDYLTGGFYPPVHFDHQPGSAPAAAAAVRASIVQLLCSLVLCRLCQCIDAQPVLSAAVCRMLGCLFATPPAARTPRGFWRLHAHEPRHGTQARPLCFTHHIHFPTCLQAASQPLHGTSSAPPHMAAAMQAAASGTQELDTFSRPSAPSLLDLEYPPPPGMPLGGGLAAVGGLQPPPAAALSAPPLGQPPRPTEVPLSASGRRMSAPRLEDEAWWDGTPALPPSRPASEPGDSSAAAAAVAAASKPTDSSDDSAFCVICLDNPSTAGVLHGDSVHK